jgi:hypothetical protein
MHIVIIPNDKGTPVCKLADAELHFEKGPLAGVKLVGFAVWESQWLGKGRHQFLRVTVPSREYDAANGERRRYDLVRPVSQADQAALEPLRDCILDAFTGGTDTAHVEPPADPAEAITRQTWRQAQAAPRQAPVGARPAPAPRPAQARSHAAPQRRHAAPPQPGRTGADDDYPF